MSKDLEEIKDRLRRIETRLTAYLEAEGFSMTNRRPHWNGEALEVPSVDCSIKACDAAIPDHIRGEVAVLCRGREVFRIVR